jgi:hypothetical protein
MRIAGILDFRLTETGIWSITVYEIRKTMILKNMENNMQPKGGDK